MIFRLTNQLVFPNPIYAEEDGLLAVGGDLSFERLTLAYSMGIFPWYSQDEPILWYSPHDRFVIFPDKIKITKSMQQFLKKENLRLEWNTHFEEIISHCQQINRKDQDGTWITTEMKNAYCDLHQRCIAKSVAVKWNDELVGGLYGVVSGAVFCGESMFSLIPNASKAALIFLCQQNKFQLIDCQFHTPHLESMGANYITREEYNLFLKG